ncbi:Tryptophan synthase alpha chain [Minicystis rosea]|nr:Tryptophan synthase alpha chain [Minicystis rosea]
MKKLSLLGFFGLLASVLAGCPIWSGDDLGSTGCHGDRCATGTNPDGCGRPADCGANETCGSDGQCHSGDCTSWSCVEGFTCVVDPDTQTASCQPGSSNTGGAGTGGSNTGGSATGGAGTGGSNTAVYCGKPSDCAAGEICGKDGTCKPGPCDATNLCIYGYTCGTDGTCQSVTPNACDSDADCSNGDLCIAGGDGKGGVCTPPGNQCFDSSQCGVSQVCVAGKCTLGCSSNADCGGVYKCDTSLGVCAAPVKTCTITNDCGSATEVCVAGGCVPRSDGGTCTDAGNVWTENGCIPNQGATFTCANDGELGATGVSGKCSTGSICLHHSCWISCDAPNQTACDNQPALNMCNAATSTSGTYNVCGGQKLGNECDPTAAVMCAGTKVCIDGFCK